MSYNLLVFILQTVFGYYKSRNIFLLTYELRITKNTIANTMKEHKTRNKFMTLIIY